MLTMMMLKDVEISKCSNAEVSQVPKVRDDKVDEVDQDGGVDGRAGPCNSCAAKVSVYSASHT